MQADLNVHYQGKKFKNKVDIWVIYKNNNYQGSKKQIRNHRSHFFKLFYATLSIKHTCRSQRV